MKSLFTIKNLLIRTINFYLGFSLFFVSCNSEKDKKPLTLVFEPYINGQPLALGTNRYPNPNGPGEFTIENFKFYLSNIGLRDSFDRLIHSEKDSYHLVRFDGDNGKFFITLKDVPKEFKLIQFSLGIDSLANHSIAVKGDLDPNNPMAWSWVAGYKFLVFEGNYYSEFRDHITPLVYHLGFTENYRTYNLNIDAKIALTEKDRTIKFRVEVASLFNTPNRINFDTLSSVTFNKPLAYLLSENLGDMISVSSN
jgi:hypothetical protein